eukprot:scaffold6861_cov78-Phaeocystis_antarctica.AAC.1
MEARKNWLGDRLSGVVKPSSPPPLGDMLTLLKSPPRAKRGPGEDVAPSGDARLGDLPCADLPCEPTPLSGLFSLTPAAATTGSVCLIALRPACSA